MSKKYNAGCKGKQITFKELKESKKLETQTATAQITIPATADSDSDSEYIANAFNVMRTSQAENNEFGFRENIAECTVEKPVNAETIPKFEKLARTPLVADKYCLICFKGDMDLEQLSQHLLRHHSIAFYGEEDDDPIDEWIAVAETWKKQGRTSPYTSSESENEASRDQSNAEQQPSSDEEQVSSPAIILPTSSTIKGKYSDSSSDSSSGNISNSKGKKKSKNSRTADKALAGVQNLETAQRNTDAQLKIILDSQLEIKSMFKSVQTDLKTVTNSVNDLYVKNNSTQTTLQTIQEGIVANTLKI